MREVLNYPEKTAALITYDRNLARRVAAELERFDIKVDDSAGIPLSLSPVGVFLRLIAEAAEDCESETKFITLLKHPFMLMRTRRSRLQKEGLRLRNSYAAKGQISHASCFGKLFLSNKNFVKESG